MLAGRKYDLGGRCKTFAEALLLFFWLFVVLMFICVYVCVCVCVCVKIQVSTPLKNNVS